MNVEIIYTQLTSLVTKAIVYTRHVVFVILIFSSVAINKCYYFILFSFVWLLYKWWLHIMHVQYCTSFFTLMWMIFVLYMYQVSDYVKIVVKVSVNLVLNHNMKVRKGAPWITLLQTRRLILEIACRRVGSINVGVVV